MSSDSIINKLERVVKRLKDLEQPLSPAVVNLCFEGFNQKDDMLNIMLEDIIQGLSEHAATKSLSMFRFTNLPFDPTPELKPDLPIPQKIQALSNSVKKRNMKTAALAKDGISLDIESTDNSNFFVNMEDLKGRITTIAAGRFVPPGFSPAKIEENQNTYSIKVARMQGAVYGGAPQSLQKPLNEALQSMVATQIPVQDFSDYKPLWFAKKEGSTVETENATIQALVVPINIGGNTINAQIAKSAPGLLNKLSNATRKGVTQRTLVKEATAFMEKLMKETTSPKEITQKISAHEEYGKIHPKLINFVVRTAMNDGFKRAGNNLASSYSSNAAFLDPNPSSKKLHQSIAISKGNAALNTLEKEPEKSRSKSEQPKKSREYIAQSPNESPNPTSKKTELKITAAWEAYGDELNTNRLAKKILEAVEPDNLIPLSQSDLKAMNNVLENMQSHPELASHAIPWLTAFVETQQKKALHLKQAPQKDNDISQTNNRSPRLSS
jgi:hypothetical protein